MGKENENAYFEKRIEDEKMRTRTLFFAVASLLLCSQVLADVTVFRAVHRKNATYAKINDAQWRIDSDGLSTFELAQFNVPAKPCQVSFVVVGVNSQPVQGTTGPIQYMPVGYIGEYTPQLGGAGHWSIHGPNGTPAATLQLEITTYVIAQLAAAVNPTYTGGSPSQCQTTNAPN